MTTHHILLALAALALIGVIAAQDYLYAPLRHESISAGLTGPYHWWLDGSYVVLAVAMVLAFSGRVMSELLAVTTGGALILTAVTNTFAGAVDKLTGGQHSIWHSRFTGVVFLAALALQVSADHGVFLWSFTGATIAAPAAMHLLSDRSDYVEKVGVLMLCLWLVAWAL